MQFPELSLAGKLDVCLTKGLCALSRGLIKTLIWLLGIGLLIAQFSEIFEYGEGLADISWGEWGFMLVFALLLWRHRVYCRHFGWGFWRGLSRLLVFQGSFLALWLVMLGLILGDAWFLGARHEWIPTSLDPIMQLIEFGVVLFTLYLAAPTRPASPLPSTVEKDVTA